MAKAKEKPAKTAKKPAKAKGKIAVNAVETASLTTLHAMREALDPGWSIAPSAASAPSAPDRKGRPITIEDVYAFQLVGDPNVSPDGSRIAVSVTHIDKEANEYRAALWLFPVNGDPPIRLTSGRWADGSPR